MNEELKKELQEQFKLSDNLIDKLSDLGVESREDMATLTADDLTKVGFKAVTARKMVAYFSTPPATTEPAAIKTASFDVLPSVPDDVSFTEMLRTGGVLKIGTVEVISAMRAAIAAKVGLFNLPDILLQRMEEFATAQEEPLGDNFYRLQKLITSRDYAEVLSAIGVKGSFVTERRKKELFARLDPTLWHELSSFQQQLVGWSDAWLKGVANPAMAMSLLALGQIGAKGAALPPGIMAPPDTAGLKDGAEGVINKINKVFAGTGIPVARALAWDAMRIREVLDDPALPVTVGAANKEQMLKSLGVNVGADYVRLENYVIRYALAVMQLPKVATGNEEYAYLSAMLQLGVSIPWDKLTHGTLTQEVTRPTGGFRRNDGRGGPEL